MRLKYLMQNKVTGTRKMSPLPYLKFRNRGFSRDVTAAMLEGKNNETAAMLEGKTNPVGVELFSYVKTFFCYNKFTWLLIVITVHFVSTMHKIT